MPCRDISQRWRIAASYPLFATWDHLRTLRLKSPSINTKVTLRVPQWEVEILRRSNGEFSLSKILHRVKPSVPPRALAKAMYLLYQLGVVNLCRNSHE